MSREQLARLYFGRDDAELDITDGGLLRAGFLRTAAYEAARTGRKRLILGRKGSGKSAICMTLAAADDSGDLATSLVTPDDVSSDEIRRFELTGIQPAMAKELVWRYVLSVQAAKYVVSHAHSHHSKSIPDSVNELRGFLVTNGEADDFRFHEKFWRVIQRLKSSISLEAFGAKVAVDLQAPSDGIRAASQLDIVEKKVVKALRDLECPTYHGGLLLLVDQLERVWTNDPDSDAMVIGLLLASKRIANRYPRVRCVTFLRSDIYDLLQFGERDKFRGEEMRIDWNTASLLDLLRVRASASLQENIQVSQLWGTLFPENTEGCPTGEYLVGHTLMRPRDLIQFANSCRDIAERNGNITVHQSDILETLQQYSLWKLQDISDEYAVNYPFLSRLFPLFEDTGYLWLRTTLERRSEQLLITLRDLYPEFSDALTPSGIIDILFGIGFLGVSRKGCPRYVYEQYARVDSHDLEFHVHPCFRPALRATNATDIRPYQPSELIGRALRQSNVSQVIGGGLHILPQRPFALQQAINRVGDRILRKLADAQLPRALRDQILVHITTMLQDTERVAENGGSTREALHQGLWVRDYLLQLANQLDQNGLGEDERVASFCQTLRDAAEGLGSPILPRLGADQRHEVWRTTKRAALIIATDTYEDSTFMRLHAARESSESLASVLADPKIGAYDVRTLHSPASHQVNLALEEFFSTAGRDDLLILYFAAHGIKDEAGRLYLTARDSRHDRIMSTAVSAAFIGDQIGRTRARRVVLLLDCCYSGAFSAGAITTGMSHEYAILTSSTSLEYSFDTEGEPGTSLFTSALVDGLRTGLADLDGDGLIEVRELYEYVHERMMKSGSPQTATLQARLTGELHVAMTGRFRPYE